MISDAKLGKRELGHLQRLRWQMLPYSVYKATATKLCDRGLAVRMLMSTRTGSGVWVQITSSGIAYLDKLGAGS